MASEYSKSLDFPSTRFEVEAANLESLIQLMCEDIPTNDDMKLSVYISTQSGDRRIQERSYVEYERLAKAYIIPEIGRAKFTTLTLDHARAWLRALQKIEAR